MAHLVIKGILLAVAALAFVGFALALRGVMPDRPTRGDLVFLFGLTVSGAGLLGTAAGFAFASLH